MKFLIISHAIHKKTADGIYAYEPYVREMNLWGKHVDEIKVLAPLVVDKPNLIDQKYKHDTVSISKIPNFNSIGKKNKVKAFIFVPFILLKIILNMFWADHIHLRCPGNVGLLGAVAQILFPNKIKTVKYAGNWDPNSNQPFSYRLQKWIISNTFLTKKCKVLVYGKWKNQSKNIVPFFTASYDKSEIIDIADKKIFPLVKFIFVGSFSSGKQPLLSVKVIKNLSKKYNVMLDMYGDGAEFEKTKKYILENQLESTVILHGNQSKETVKKAYQDAHFLIFISKSEGWPKVVAEAMFWKCLPISSNVSCVDYMLGGGKRGSVLDLLSDENTIENVIVDYLEHEDVYQHKVFEAQKWSQKFTLNSFENEIKKLITFE